MTPLPHNPAITVIDLPEDDKPLAILGTENTPFLETENDLLELPTGNWKLLNAQNDAKLIVEYLGPYGLYKNYKSERQYPEIMFKEPTASLRSLITSNGWKNPVFLRKEK